MTEQDMIIQDLRRENENLRAELEWKQEEIELARRHARQWISVEDRLPSAEVDVLVLTRSKSVCQTMKIVKVLSFEEMVAACNAHGNRRTDNG